MQPWQIHLYPLTNIILNPSVCIFHQRTRKVPSLFDALSCHHSNENLFLCKYLQKKSLGERRISLGENICIITADCKFHILWQWKKIPWQGATWMSQPINAWILRNLHKGRETRTCSDPKHRSGLETYSPFEQPEDKLPRHKEAPVVEDSISVVRTPHYSSTSFFITPRVSGIAQGKPQFL